MGVARPQGLGWTVLAIGFSAFGSSFISLATLLQF
jgi:hypothetical protein